MNLCGVCGVRLAALTNLCAYHGAPTSDSWAGENRLMCDFVHRGIVPTRADEIAAAHAPRAHGTATADRR